MSCICQSGQEFQSCCQPAIKGERWPPDPSALMRSRYTAFCLNQTDYLLDSWHEETRPENLSSDEPGGWVKLEVIDCKEDDLEAWVEFKALLIYGSTLETLHERSYFLKVEGRWLYHSGDFLNEGQHLAKIAKGGLCPCGSGKKFKRCHLKPE